ncbi:WGxxGxxG family protein [Saccharomonospora xinjiangensis]|uniref:WGxxGxxG family protein n=1 Tax=Saccharomonospora xinjiangensis TaxID=75294 RepID=UPI00106F4F97|nr:WGxxGxxG family protein [Saccharomonospora xinjiangensis]QBQ61084.1 hypothetical protein EYD13_13660 [Saccharomonospora xinjiangensis]
MRKVTACRTLAVACVIVPLVGAPSAYAAPTESTAQAQVSAQQSSAQPSGEADDGSSWGLLGLAGLLGLVGLARRRRRPVVADPFAAYPVMRAPGPAAQPGPGIPPHGSAAVFAPSHPLPSPQHQPAPREGSRENGAASPAAHTAPAIPEQSRGSHEQLWTERPAQRCETAVPGLSPTSVTSDGTIRLAPAPPLHANRLSPPNLDISGAPGMADASGTAAEPRWPQREYD